MTPPPNRAQREPAGALRLQFTRPEGWVAEIGSFDGFLCA
jgi:hypothetical protein